MKVNLTTALATVLILSGMAIYWIVSDFALTQVVDFMSFILFFSAAGAAVYLWVSLYRGTCESITFKE